MNNESARISEETAIILSDLCQKVIPAGVAVDLGTGCGGSLGIMAEYLPPELEIYTVDNNLKYQDEVRAHLINRKFDPETIHFIHARIGGNSKTPSGKWYRAGDLVGQIPGPITLLFVDGPEGKIGRGPALEYFLPQLPPGAIIVLDDLRRHEEAVVFRKWREILSQKEIRHSSQTFLTDRGLGVIELI